MSTEKREKGFMLVFVVGVIVVVLGIILVAVVINKPKKQNNLLDVDSSQNEKKETRRISGNVERKNDASILASAVDEFMNNNSGRSPTSWSDGQLKGEGQSTYASVGLMNVYESSQVVMGKQDVLTTDTIRLATKATCQPDGSTVASKSATGYAIQFTEIRTDGSIKGLCFP